MIDHANILLVFNSCSFLNLKPSQEQYFKNFRVSIQLIEDPKKFKKIEVGYLEINVFDLHSAIDNGYSIDSIICKAYHYDTLRDIFDLGYDEIDFRICMHFDYPLPLINVAEIEKFNIKQKFRHSGLGEKVLKSVIDYFSDSCGLFVVKSFPLQFDEPADEEYSYSEFKYPENIAFKKLRAFYKRCGFHEIPIFKDYMFCYKEPAYTNYIINILREKSMNN